MSTDDTDIEDEEEEEEEEEEEDEYDAACARVREELMSRRTLYIDDAGNLSLFDEMDTILDEEDEEAGVDEEAVVNMMTEAILAAVPDDFDGVRITSGGMGSGEWPIIKLDRINALKAAMPGWEFSGDGAGDDSDDEDDAE